jgi:hypothetical protein
MGVTAMLGLGVAGSVGAIVVPFSVGIIVGSWVRRTRVGLGVGKGEGFDDCDTVGANVGFTGNSEIFEKENE